MNELVESELCQATPEQIAGVSKSSFLIAFAGLKPERKAALVAVYSFCRVIDDAVDEAKTASEGRQSLAAWREELERAYEGEPLTPLGKALARAARVYGVERRWLELVVEGCAMDLESRVYATLQALEQYTFRVASAVGRACLPVFGAEGAERYADELGHALQLTNILRDLVPDARAGRVYAPQDLLLSSGADLRSLRGEGPAQAYADGGPVHRVVKELARHARGRFATAHAHLPVPAHARVCLRPARIMAAIYEDLLGRIEARRGRILGPRLRVPRWKKLWLAWRT